MTICFLQTLNEGVVGHEACVPLQCSEFVILGKGRVMLMATSAHRAGSRTLTLMFKCS